MYYVTSETACSCWLLLNLISVDDCQIGLLQVQAAGDSALRTQQDQAAMLRCWLRAALDSHCRAAFADLTQQLRACSALEFLPLGNIDAVRHPASFHKIVDRNNI